MKNLIVDVGNTNTKLFLFDKNSLAYKAIEPNDTQFFDMHILKQLHKEAIENCIISSVNKLNDEKLKFFEENYNTVFFNNKMKLPIDICYKTPDTLGMDRVANVCGASVLFPDKNVLIIDAGTAITYDILENGRKYLGGNISPGILTRFKSLHTFTEKLPLLTINNSIDEIYGDSTENAIINGVQNGVKYEITGTINAFKKIYKDLTIVLTGGDTFFFEKSFKMCIFVEPNLTAIGLNKILEIKINV
jgi:type III pantothenate kinase